MIAMRNSLVPALVFSCGGVALIPAVLSGQAPADSAVFSVLHGGDTVAVEHFAREGHELRGELLEVVGDRQRTRYRATLLDDATAPLIEFSVWHGDDPATSLASARKSGRVIFKGDSAAVDEADWAGGLRTFMLGTEGGAVPYLNLSFAFLEQAIRRAQTLARDSVMVPFFNLGGGQTVDGSVVREGTDSTLVRIGRVEFRLRVDPAGRILGGAIPTQSLMVTRTP
jgi:hypothetical protein